MQALFFMPMKKSCVYCGKIHDRSFNCPSKPKRFTGGTDEAKERSKAIWQKKRTEIKERDLYVCQACIRGYDREAIINAKNIEIHHIIKIKADKSLWLENSNLISLCRRHHEMAENNQISEEILRKWATEPLKNIPGVKKKVD